MSNPTGISFDTLFSNASMGILVTSENGTIVLVNPYLLNQFGYIEKDLIGEKVEKLIPMSVRARHQGHVQHYSEHPKNRPMGLGMDLYAARKDGSEFPVEVSLGKYHTDSGHFVVAFVSDITKRKAAERELQLLNEELEQKIELRTMHLKKAEADLRIAFEREKELSELKSRFISIASHEFRTPLTTILSSAYLISKYIKKEENPKREKHIQHITSAVNMLNAILNDFLSVGKIEEGKVHVHPTLFDLSSHLQQIIEELEGLLKTGQKINYKHNGESLVEMDSNLLKHIMINLLFNAIKFSHEHSLIEIFSDKLDSNLTISVCDKGIGVSEEDRKHLSERFFRGKNAIHIQGTGLGLHIVSKYTELMRGTIHCESKLGEGSKFIISFNL